MKLSVKLSLAMGALTLIIAISNIFSMIQINKVNLQSTVLADNWLPSIQAVEEMNTILSDYRIAEIQHTFATSDTEMARRERDMQELSGEFAVRQKNYEALPMSEEGRRLYNEFQTQYRRYQDLHKEVAVLSRENKTEEAMKILNGPSFEAYQSISKLVQQIVALSVSGGNKASEEGDELYQSASLSLTVLLVLSLLLAVGVTIFIVRGTMSQLGKDPGELGTIAQRVTDGDYDIDDGSTRRGVYGNIVNMVEALKTHIDNAEAASRQAEEESARALEAMKNAEAAGNEARSKTEAMLAAADRLEHVANVVSSASAELSAQIEQSERGASEQAARVAETATAMEEMNSTVLEVARNAGSASEVSTATRSRAEAGADVVRKAVESIQEVQRQSVLLKEDMQTLGENSQAISRIMGVISDIADQTNLLALNAAIEAARAGEAGRGFAVVADEVRKLAEKTMASTTDVGNAIKAIQLSADKSMHQLDTAVQSIEQATDFARQSGTALSEIVSMVDSSADQVRAIATASEQQSSTSEEINRSMNQVNTIAADTARAMQEAAQAVSDLSGQAHELTQLIDDMKRG